MTSINSFLALSSVVAISLIAPSCAKEEQQSAQEIAKTMVSITQEVTKILESAHDTSSAADAATKLADINKSSKEIEKAYLANKKAVDSELKKHEAEVKEASLKLIPALKKTTESQYYGNKELEAQIKIFTGA